MPASKSPTVDVDEVLDKLGTYGRWQMSVMVSVCLAMVPTACASINIVFLAYEPSHYCNNEAEHEFNETATASIVNTTSPEPEQCTLYNSTSNSSDTCTTGWVYDVQRQNTMAAEWNMVCDRNFISELSQTLFMVGQAIGAYVFPALADRFGRRRVFIIAHWIFVIFSVVTGFLPNARSFIALRFFHGIIQQAIEICPFIIAMELMPAPFVSLVIGGFWVTSLLITDAIAFACRTWSWRHVQFMYCILSLPLLYDTFFMPESLRWLFINNKQKEAMQLLKKAAKMNKVPFDSIMAIVEKSGTEMSNVGNPGDFIEKEPLTDGDAHGNFEEPKVNDKLYDGSEIEVKRYSIIDAIRHKALRTIFLASLLAWMSNTLIYNGMYFMSGILPGGRFLNFFLGCLVELPAFILGSYSLKRFGRRRTIIVANLLCVVCLVPAFFMQIADGEGLQYPISALLFAGKFFVSASLLTLWIFTPEVYPTNLRSLGTGCGALAGRVGSIAAPFSVYLGKTISWAPILIFGLFAIAGTFSTFLLPETKGRKLPDTLEDVDKWKEDDLKEGRGVTFLSNFRL